MNATGFYLRDSRNNVGSTCMFWAKDGRGYTSDLDRAEIYSLAQAQCHINDRETDRPLSVPLVDELATVRVDHQDLDPARSGVIAGCTQYVVQIPGNYDGNDVYWMATDSHSVNFSAAMILTADEARKNAKHRVGVIYAFEYVQSISRRTLQVSNVNERKMITAAGIRKPKWTRSRATTGKTRGNCPHCGKLTWGYNPHEAYSCADVANEKHGFKLFDGNDCARVHSYRGE